MTLMHTPPHALGTFAPDFALKDPFGALHTLASCRGPKATLVAFICNHCPYVQRIIADFAQDAGALQSVGVGVIALMPNDYALYTEDAPSKMALFAKAHGFTFPYLVDENGIVAKAYGAVCTPDFFGFDAAGRLAWRGNAAEIRSAMTALAQDGAAPQRQTPSMGCSIKWKE